MVVNIKRVACGRHWHSTTLSYWNYICHCFRFDSDLADMNICMVLQTIIVPCDDNEKVCVDIERDFLDIQGQHFTTGN